MKFELVSPFKPTGDQPQAIENLVAGVKDQEKAQVLLGVTGSGKTFTVANTIARGYAGYDANDKATWDARLASMQGLPINGARKCLEVCTRTLAYNLPPFIQEKAGNKTKKNPIAFSEKKRNGSISMPRKSWKANPKSIISFLGIGICRST